MASATPHLRLPSEHHHPSTTWPVLPNYTPWWQQSCQVQTSWMQMRWFLSQAWGYGSGEGVNRLQRGWEQRPGHQMVPMNLNIQDSFSWHMSMYRCSIFHNEHKLAQYLYYWQVMCDFGEGVKMRESPTKWLGYGRPETEAGVHEQSAHGHTWPDTSPWPFHHNSKVLP